MRLERVFRELCLVTGDCVTKDKRMILAFVKAAWNTLVRFPGPGERDPVYVTRNRFAIVHTTDPCPHLLVCPSGCPMTSLTIWQASATLPSISPVKRFVSRKMNSMK